MSAGSNPLCSKPSTAQGQEQPQTQENLLTGRHSPAAAGDALEAEPFSCRVLLPGALSWILGCWGQCFLKHQGTIVSISISPALHQVREVGSVLEEHSARQKHDMWGCLSHVQAFRCLWEWCWARWAPRGRNPQSRRWKGEAAVAPHSLVKAPGTVTRIRKPEALPEVDNSTCSIWDTHTHAHVPRGTLATPTVRWQSPFLQPSHSSDCYTQVCGLGVSNSSWDLVWSFPTTLGDTCPITHAAASTECHAPKATSPKAPCALPALPPGPHISYQGIPSFTGDTWPQETLSFTQPQLLVFLGLFGLPSSTPGPTMGSSAAGAQWGHSEMCQTPSIPCPEGSDLLSQEPPPELSWRKSWELSGPSYQQGFSGGRNLPGSASSTRRGTCSHAKQPGNETLLHMPAAVTPTWGR